MKIHRYRLCAAALLLLPFALAAPPAAAQAPPVAIDHPGFLDFSELGLQAEGDELRVEVNLQDAVLAFVAEAMRGSDTELADALGKIRSIRFQLFELPADRFEAVRSRSRGLADRLERRGWQRVVRIQEESLQSFLHLKMEGNRILGLTVTFFEQEEGKFGFINIAGEIDPAQLGRIGRQFDIDVLEEAQRNLGTQAGSEEPAPEAEPKPADPP